MILTKEQLKSILVEPGHVTQKNFDASVQEAEEEGRPIPDVVVARGLVTDPQMAQLLSIYYHVPFIDFHKIELSDDLLSLIPEAMARAKGLVLFKRDEQGAHVVMRNPKDLELTHALEKRLGHPIIAYFSGSLQLEEALSRYSSGLGEQFSSIFSKLETLPEDSEERDRLVVTIADLLLQYGAQNEASDIHIEPLQKTVRVRFRIDGVMHDMLKMPKRYYDLVLTRLKILAKMRTDEHRSAQDGKLRFRGVAGESIDVRVSVVPVTEGENVVMRLLSSHGAALSLSELGMHADDFARVQQAINNPHGMILVTGPTGSGKTTTAYAVLKILNRSNIHIATIEDPVEYDIEGVTQIQVNKRTHLTFADGLRALVRQDPDIILVGEVRDQETARIAVNSAMTGHLVLSTLHANDAPTTLPRLLDMGIEPFLIASTVNVVIAQRLVRRICGSCRASTQLTPDEIAAIQADKAVVETFKQFGKKDLSKMLVFKGTGCNVCGDTGYNGRSGIFEVLLMSHDVKQQVLARGSADEIKEAAKKNGMRTMLEDGVAKVLAGETTVAEVLRVTKG